MDKSPYISLEEAVACFGYIPMDTLRDRGRYRSLDLKWSTTKQYHMVLSVGSGNLILALNYELCEHPNTLLATIAIAIA